MQYSQALESRFRDPAWTGQLPPGEGVLRGRADTPASDAEVELNLQIVAGRVEKARFRAYGCPVTIALADWTCEWLQGRTLDELDGLTIEGMEQALALEAPKRFCALLIEDALADAVARWPQ